VMKFLLNLSLIFLVAAKSIEPAVAAQIDILPANDGLVLVMISGKIEFRDDVDYRLKTMGVPKAIVTFNSPGGNLDAGLNIGRQIREQGFATLVGTKLCASACALAWLGGSRRYLLSNASIGFHAAYISDGNYKKESGLANALVGSYLTRLGLSDKAITYITSAHPEELNWLDLKSASQLGIEVLSLNQGEIRKSTDLTIVDSKNAKRAAKNFYKRLVKYGMNGMMESIDQCYKIAKNKKDLRSLEYCLILDWVARSFDKQATEMYKLPRHWYFSDEKVENRFRQVIAEIGNPKFDMDTFIREATAIAENYATDVDLYDEATKVKK
jgi:hypothetical protein